MIQFPKNKIYNSYLIETNNYENTKQQILQFAIDIGFSDILVYANHPDLIFVELNGMKQKKDLVRNEVVDVAYHSPLLSKKKIFVIYDEMGYEKDTQSLLLKTLEDAPSFNIYFLICTNISKISDTIKSRCLILRDIENKIIDFSGIQFFSDAVFMLCNINFLKITDVMKFSEQFYNNEEYFKQLIDIFRYVLRDAFLYKKTMLKNKMYLKGKESDIMSFANNISFSMLGYLTDKLFQLSKMRKLNINKKNAVFNYLMNTMKN